jgi:hypothetical protein
VGTLDDELITYGFVDRYGERRWAVFDDLRTAVVHALLALQFGETKPIGIRQGGRALYWSLDLVALWMEYRELLEAGGEWLVLERLHVVPSAPVSAPGTGRPRGRGVQP